MKGKSRRIQWCTPQDKAGVAEGEEGAGDCQVPTLLVVSGFSPRGPSALALLRFRNKLAYLSLPAEAEAALPLLVEAWLVCLGALRFPSSFCASRSAVPPPLMRPRFRSSGEPRGSRPSGRALSCCRTASGSQESRTSLPDSGLYMLAYS